MTSIDMPRTWYCTGTSKPVDIGLTLKGGEYQLKAYHSDIADWGFGDDELSWTDSQEYRSFLCFLARSPSGKYVCLQVWSPESSQDSALDAELRILDRLATVSNSPAMRQFVHAPIDKFVHTIQEGDCLCLVYDLYGPNLSFVSWPEALVWKAAKDIMEALQFLHSKGLCHARLDRSAFVITYPRLDAYDEALVMDLFNKTSSNMDKGVREVNDSGTDREGKLPNMNVQIKLQSFGSQIEPNRTPSAFFENEHTAIGNQAPTDWNPALRTQSLPQMKLHYEVPPLELLVGEPYTRASDIWYAALQIGALAQGIQADVGSFLISRRFDPDAVKLAAARRYLGEIPASFYEMLISNKAIISGDPALKLFRPLDDYNPSVLRRCLKPPHLENGGVAGMKDEDYDSLAELLRAMLKWRADERPTATEILANDFFSKDRLY